ncbi:MAG: hypothetical protein ACRC8A_15530 [Microcoleaceae cyanobacterium]
MFLILVSPQRWRNVLLSVIQVVPMGDASRYWNLVKLESSGQCKVAEIALAKAFFTSKFPQFKPESEVPDTRIQQDLLCWRQTPAAIHSPEFDPVYADLCLLCFISQEIEQVCTHLEGKYGKDHHFNRHDLYPFVLDEQGEIHRPNPSPYQSFAREILQSFNPEQSSLGTWVNRRVKSHIELNAFLLEQGVYLVSNWAILNDTRPQQLPRLLATLHQLTPSEIADNIGLLSSYHTIYRTQRLQQRQSGSHRRCQPPTKAQYEQIAQLVAPQRGREVSVQMVAKELQVLATRLRDYRVYARGGQTATQSLEKLVQDRGEVILGSSFEPIEDEAVASETVEFLQRYRQELLYCLDAAIAEVTQSRKTQLQKRGSKSEQFLKALRLFHCRGHSMGEIAQELGLKAQYQVSRLLNLKAFRADIRQQLLLKLRDRILEVAKNYVDAKRLVALDQEIEAALDEEVAKVMQTEESNSHIANNRPLNSVFAKQLCSQIDPSKPAESIAIRHDS